MNPAHWLSIRSLFEQALELPQAERAALMQAQPDRAIVLAVERMLDEHASADTLLDQSLGVLTPTGSFRPQPGDVLCGRFRIERQAGRGGMGVVYQALDLYLDCAVAIKVIEFTASNQDEWTRFKREIHLARSIAHANVCRVFDLHLHRQGERETPLLAMEFVPGPTAAESLV